MQHKVELKPGLYSSKLNNVVRNLGFLRIWVYLNTPALLLNYYKREKIAILSP